MAKSAFQEALSQAVADLLERGFQTEEQLLAWLSRLRTAAHQSLPPESELRRRLTSTLDRTFRNTLKQVPRRHAGVSAFTVKQLEPELRKELDKRILASANLIRLNREDAIRKTLQRFEGWATAIPQGGTRAQTRQEAKEDLGKAMRGVSFRERRVDIDQGHKLVNSINFLVARREEAIAAVWHSHWREAGYDYRPEHKKLDQRVLLVPGTWAVEDGYVKKGELFTDQVEAPAMEIYCFPGSSKVPFARGVEIAYRRWYSGELTTLVTASGKTLKLTPNHPVLTPVGWRAGKLLQEGDEVIEIPEESFSAIESIEANNYKKIPVISEIFSSVKERGVSERTTGFGNQFHGDGAEGDVDVVGAARSLSFGLVADLLQLSKQGFFSKTFYFGAGISAFDFFIERCLRAAASFMRGLGELGAPLTPYALHAEFVGLGTISQRSSEARSESSPRYAETFGDREQAFPFPVRRTRVVKIESRQWAGHVYNLQTQDGWYSAEGVIVHNCRCYYTYLYDLADLPEELLTAKGKMVLKGERRAANG